MVVREAGGLAFSTLFKVSSFGIRAFIWPSFFLHGLPLPLVLFIHYTFMEHILSCLFVCKLCMYGESMCVIVLAEDQS